MYGPPVCYAGMQGPRKGTMEVSLWRLHPSAIVYKRKQIQRARFAVCAQTYRAGGGDRRSSRTMGVGCAERKTRHREGHPEATQARTTLLQLFSIQRRRFPVLAATCRLKRRPCVQIRQPLRKAFVACPPFVLASLPSLRLHALPRPHCLDKRAVRVLMRISTPCSIRLSVSSPRTLVPLSLSPHVPFRTSLLLGALNYPSNSRTATDV